MIGSDNDQTGYFFEIFISGFKILAFGFKCAALSEILFSCSLNMIYKLSVNCQTVTAPDRPAQ